MKMEVNWQMVINFILFAMLVVAFTFAIWSYVKTNTIKNSDSGSVPSIINDNNTYVNNISSAPNLVRFPLGNADQTYKLKSTDNGSTILITSSGGTKANFDVGFGVVDSKNNRIMGYYIQVINGNLSGGGNIDIYSNFNNNSMSPEFTLAPGEYGYYFQSISELNNPAGDSSGWYSPV
jgi:hypothetical protein